ncbi:MAG: hypothetical protein DRI71_11030 [Bacteroidetes bacterium]|nr:MAG: hypothetical protein DRI71_11030 [Bacteroidota bacterium]
MRSSLVILAVGLVSLALTYLIFVLAGWQWHQNFIVISVYLVLLTLLSHHINLISTSQEGRGVIIPYLVSTVLKLIFSGGFLLVIVKLYPEMVKGLVIVFLIYYAAFSTLEIILVSRRTGGKKF